MDGLSGILGPSQGHHVSPCRYPPRHYDVTSLIGEGGMGEVWQARDTKLDRDVALKVLPEAFTSDPDRLARFEGGHPSTTFSGVVVEQVPWVVFQGITSGRSGGVTTW